MMRDHVLEIAFMTPCFFSLSESHLVAALLARLEARPAAAAIASA